MEQILSEFYSLRRDEGEEISNFNRRFASFYYNMPKEVKPLENTAKIYYATTFPPDLSLLLLERKSTTLQQMFVDCLEVEENLKMSRKLSDQDNGGEITDTYKFVGPYKQKREAYGPSKISHDTQKDGRPEAEINSPIGLFSEYGDPPRSWSTKDDFKK